ncbi:MAG: AgmX/PglI C-terminal domain-containing protein [Myxococcota bacterium]
MKTLKLLMALVASVLSLASFHLAAKETQRLAVPPQLVPPPVVQMEWSSPMVAREGVAQYWTEPSPKPEPKRRRASKKTKARLLRAEPLRLAEPDEAMRLALRRAKPVLERCYDSELKKRAPFNGFVVLEVSVTADGRVERAKVEQASTRDAAVAGCIARRLKTLKLPPLSSEADLVVPFRLEAIEG